MNTPELIHSLVDRNLDFFFFVITNDTALIPLVYTSLCACMSFSIENRPRVQLLD